MAGFVQFGFRPNLLSASAGRRSALDHLRWVSALAVCVAHIRNLTVPDAQFVTAAGPAEKVFYFVTLFATQAVVVFFVVSGMLVGGSLLKQVHARRFEGWAYARDRLSRLYVVLIPALALTAILGLAGDSTSCRAGAGVFDLLGSLVFVQNIVGTPPCNNHPLWSLSNEAFYYVAAPVALLLATGGRKTLWLAALAVLAALSLPSLVHGAQSLPFGLLLWACGLAPWFVKIRLPAIAAIVPLLLALAIARVHVVHSEYIEDILIAITTAAFLSADFAERTGPAWMVKLGAGLAAFSYSLYLVHMPVGQAMAHFLTPSGALTTTAAHIARGALLRFLVAVGAAVMTGWVFGRVFEANTPRVRRWLGGGGHDLRTPLVAQDAVER